jgi:hypothetical protein
MQFRTSVFPGLILPILITAACASTPSPPLPLPAEPLRHITLESKDPHPATVLSFSLEELMLLQRAIARADSVVSDSTYRRLLTQMGSSQDIKWERGHLRLVPVEGRHDPAEWFLARFLREGNFTLAEIHPVEPDSVHATVAWTSACAPSVCALETYLNPWVIRSWEGEGYPYGLTNTLIHERIHAFGLEHAHGQKRWPNACDFAYVAGDVAEVMLRSRAAGAAVPEDADEPLCPAVRRRLVTAGLIMPAGRSR